jgi:hypothetical protein
MTGDAGLLRAKATFNAPGVRVAKGDVFGSADPIVAGREHLFEPVPPVDESGPETVVRAKPAKKARPKGGESDHSG